MIDALAGARRCTNATGRRVMRKLACARWPAPDVLAIMVNSRVKEYDAALYLSALTPPGASHLRRCQLAARADLLGDQHFTLDLIVAAPDFDICRALRRDRDDVENFAVFETIF